MPMSPKGFVLVGNISEHLFSMWYNNLVPIRDILSGITNFKSLNSDWNHTAAFLSKDLNVLCFISILNKLWIVYPSTFIAAEPVYAAIEQFKFRNYQLFYLPFREWLCFFQILLCLERFIVWLFKHLLFCHSSICFCEIWSIRFSSCVKVMFKLGVSFCGKSWFW